MTGAVRAETLKLFSTRMWWGLLLGMVALIALNGLSTAIFAGQELGGGAPAIPALDTREGLSAVYGSGYQAGYLVLAVLGSIVAAADYRHRTVTQTFLATPARGTVIGAKLVVAAGVGAVFGLLAQVATVVMTSPVILLRGESPGLADPDVLRSLALGILGIAVWAVLGTAIGLLLRNQVAAILLIVAVVFVLDFVISLILGGLELDALVPYTPNNASSAVVEGFTGFDLLPWWGGALVLLGYGLAATVLAYAVSIRRDVT